MKGQALITIKTKDGKVKQQVKSNNVVFDIPKDIMKDFVESADIGTNIPLSDSSYISMSSGYNNIFNILGFYLWFMSICVNDETCSEQTYKNFKMPVLYGGEYTKQDSSNNRYAYIDTTNSSINGNVMKKSYTWNNCPAFTIRSINLKHGYNSFGGVYTMMFGNYPIKKYGKYHWFTGSINSGNYSLRGLLPNVLAEKDTFSWSKGWSGRTYKTVVKNHTFSTSGSTFSYPQTIYACKDREIILLRRSNDLTTDDSQYSAYPNERPIRYLFVIDADTGNVKRSFEVTQFSGVELENSYPYYNLSLGYTKIIATDYGNFLLSTTKNPSHHSDYKMCLWRIPDQSEMSNYSNNETIPVWKEDLKTYLPNLSYFSWFTIVVDNYIIYSANGDRRTIKINSATPDDVTIYNYVPFNLPSSINTSSISSKYDVYSKYGDAMYNPYYSGVETWYNTTVLNLSEGVEVSQGDTVTIEYTITAN